jgi:hypothetical protein
MAAKIVRPMLTLPRFINRSLHTKPELNKFAETLHCIIDQSMAHMMLRAC